ncbi:rho GTPase-activating protein 28 [Trichonephila clavipes]|nr:rho GTPase-activating protein 28 [Trichonephila clavipes]
MEHRDRLSRISESGGVGVPLEDYWKEFNSFDEGGQGEEDEEDISKTPDEGEAEEEWLREAGFENLVDSEMTEQDEAEFYEDILATLTARQIAVVKKRLDTVQMSKKRRVPRSRQRADVRELFNHASTSPPESLSTIHSEPLSMNLNMDSSTLSSSAPSSERWSRKPTLPPSKSTEEPPSTQPPSSKPNTRALPPLPFLRTGHTGGFSLRDRSRGIDCESPTSVEVLRYETRKSTIQDSKDIGSVGSMSSISTEPFSLETGFQEISSRMNSVSDLVVYDTQ